MRNARGLGSEIITGPHDPKRPTVCFDEGRKLQMTSIGNPNELNSLVDQYKNTLHVTACPQALK